MNYLFNTLGHLPFAIAAILSSQAEIVSTQTISISRAANYLSKFVNSDNGASQSVTAYLRRASTSFKELASVNKQTKRRSKEAGSINLGINPRNSEENESRVLDEFGYSSIEGKLRTRRIEDDHVMETTTNRSGDYSNLNKKKKKKRRSEDYD